MEAFNIVYAPAKKFVGDCKRVLTRCTLPSAKVIKKTAISTGVGFCILGSVGFVFKLVSKPINNVLIGGMVH